MSIVHPAVIGHQVAFPSASNQRVAWIDTRRLDLAAFAWSHPTTFTLQATTPQGVRILWIEETAEGDIFGYTLPRKLFSLGDVTRLISLDLVATPASNHPYYIHRSGNMLASQTLAPDVSLHRQPARGVLFLHPSCNLPCPIPGITWHLPVTSSPVISWHITHQPMSEFALYDAEAFAASSVSSLRVSSSSNTIEVIAPIFLSNQVYVHAVQSEGLFQTMTADVVVAEPPRIRPLSSLPLMSVAEGSLSNTFAFVSDVPAAGPLQWSLDTPHAGARMDPDGSLRLAPDHFIHHLFTVSASNVLGAQAFYTFPVLHAQKPFIPSIPRYLRAIAPGETVIVDDFNVPQKGTGPLQWGIDPPSLPNISVDPHTGRIEASYGEKGISVREFVTLHATNILGARCNHTLYLHMASPPELLPSPPQHITFGATSAQYRIPRSSPSSMILRWSMEPPSLPGVQLTQEGVLQFASNTYQPPVEARVFASNLFGQTSSTTMSIGVAQRPFLRSPGTIQTYIDTEDYTFSILQTQSNTGPLLWYLPAPRTGLSVVDGRISIAVNCPILSEEITVCASNIFGHIESVTFPITVTQFPRIDPPPDNHIRISWEDFPVVVPFRVQANTQRDIRWASPCNLSGVLLDTDSGELLVVPPVSLQEEPYHVVARNQLGSSALQTRLTIAQRPHIGGPSLLQGNILPGGFLSWGIPQTATYTGPLSWYFTGYVPSGLTIHSASPSQVELRFSPYRDVVPPVSFSLAASNLAGGVHTSMFSLQVRRVPTIDTALLQTSFRQSLSPGTELRYEIPVVENLLPPDMIWSLEDNTSPAIQLTTQGEIRVAATAPTSNTIRVRVANRDGASTSAQLHIRTAPTPQLQVPSVSPSQNLPPNTSFEFGLVQQTPSTGPLIWNVTSHPLTQSLTDPSFPYHGISIRPESTTSGVAATLRVSSNTGIANHRIFVTCSNEVGGWDRIYFPMTITRTPVIPSLSPIRLSNVSPISQNLSIPQTTAGTGPLTWSVTPSPLFTISSLGLLTLPLQFFQGTVTVTAQNELGVSCNQSFLLEAAQLPSFVLPSPQSLTLTTSPYTLSLTQTTQGTAPAPNSDAVTWSVYSTSSLLQISPSGVISFPTSQYVDDTRVQVDASNTFGGVTRRTGSFRLAQKPSLSSVWTVGGIGSFECNVSPFSPVECAITIEQTASGTGPLSWSLSNGALSPGSACRLEYPTSSPTSIPMSNVLVLQGAFQEQMVRVTAQGTTGGTDSQQLRITLLQTPMLALPPVLASVNLRAQDVFTIDLPPPVNSNLSGPVQWYFPPSFTPPTGLSVHPTTGRLTYVLQTPLDTWVDIGASNALQASSQHTVRVRVYEKPALGSPWAPAELPLTFTFDTEVSLERQVPLLSSCSGALTWSVTSATGEPLPYIHVDPITCNLIITSNAQVDNQTVRIVAENPLGEQGTTEFQAQIYRRPKLLIPAISLHPQTLATSEPFSFELSNEPARSNTGALTWTVASSPVLHDLTWNSPRPGVLHVALPYIAIHHQMTFTATNPLGISDTVSFPLRITQIPSINVPAEVRLSRPGIMEYPISQSYLRSLPLTWSVTPQPSGLRIDPSTTDPLTAILSLPANQSVENTSVTLRCYTTDVPAASNEKIFLLDALQTPLLTPLSNGLSDTLVSSADYSYAMTLSSSNHGVIEPLRWTISDVQGQPISNLSIHTHTGVITYMGTQALKQDVRVQVSNRIMRIRGDPSSEYVFPMRLVGMPSFSNMALTTVSTITDTTASITWSPLGTDISYVSLSNLCQATPTYDLLPWDAPPSFTVASLLPNTSNVWRVTPQNFRRLSNLDSVLDTPQFYTHASKVSSPTLSVRGSQDLTVTWGAATAQYVLVDVTDLSTSQTVVHSNMTPATVSHVLGNLTPNRSYQYAWISVNDENTSNQPVILSPVSTHATLASAQIDSVTSNTVTLSWQPAFVQSYLEVSLAWKPSQTADPFQQQRLPWGTSQVTLVGLSPSTSYQLEVVPVNLTQVQSSTPIQLQAVTTASISGVQVSLEGTEMRIRWNTSTFAYVDVRWKEVGALTDQVIQNILGADVYISLALVPYGESVFDVIPYNSTGIAGERKKIYFSRTTNLLAWRM